MPEIGNGVSSVEEDAMVPGAKKGFRNGVRLWAEGPCEAWAGVEGSGSGRSRGGR
jgi:hypothetical protein